VTSVAALATEVCGLVLFGMWAPGGVLLAAVLAFVPLLVRDLT
jgi:hypothetical protein